MREINYLDRIAGTGKVVEDRQVDPHSHGVQGGTGVPTISRHSLPVHHARYSRWSEPAEYR